MAGCDLAKNVGQPGGGWEEAAGRARGWLKEGPPWQEGARLRPGAGSTASPQPGSLLPGRAPPV